MYSWSVDEKRFKQKLPLFLANQKHPSFHSRKMSGADKFEARLSYHYRFTYKIIGGELWFLSIGPHDVGLGKK